MRVHRAAVALAIGLALSASTIGLASASTSRGTSAIVFAATPGFSATTYFGASWTVTS